MASDPYIAAILVGLIRLIGSFFGTLLLKKFKRKVLMMSSALLMALMLAALAATVYYKDKIAMQQPSTTSEEEASKSLFEKGLVVALKVLPLAEMILYILFFGLGVGTVPWLLLGTIMIRVTAGGLAISQLLLIYHWYLRRAVSSKGQRPSLWSGGLRSLWNHLPSSQAFPYDVEPLGTTWYLLIFCCSLPGFNRFHTSLRARN